MYLAENRGGGSTSEANHHMVNRAEGGGRGRGRGTKDKIPSRMSPVTYFLH
jgi:hypothetical protein